MQCQRCNSYRILEMNAKASDCQTYDLQGAEKEGYAPDIEDICQGDYVFPKICLDCGQVAGKFPKETPKELLPREKKQACRNYDRESFSDVSCRVCGFMEEDHEQ